VARGKGRGGGTVFRFQLGWGGLAGLILMMLCLFGWMFLLGVWAGQTILFPVPGKEAGAELRSGRQPPLVQAEQGKRRPAPVEKK